MPLSQIVVGTTNQAKIAQIRGALAPIGVRVVGVVDKDSLPKVAEDGKTVAENAEKKALAYARALRTEVLSMDNGLYFDGLSEAEQPGMFVRRIGGKEAKNDDELIAFYRDLIIRLGGQVKGRWEFGVCVANAFGRAFSTTIVAPRFFTGLVSSRVIHGYPLESLQIDPETGYYISEMSESEQALFWRRTIGDELRTFVQDISF